MSSDDGADLGFMPDQALEAILGGSQPTADKVTSRTGLEIKIRSASLSVVNNYDEAGLAAARIVLEYLEDHPEDKVLPPENVYDFSKMDTDKSDNFEAYLISKGLYDTIEHKDPARAKILEGLGLTGFLWGWGFNAAHYVLRLEHHPNSAILHL